MRELFDAISSRFTYIILIRKQINHVGDYVVIFTTISKKVIARASYVIKLDDYCLRWHYSTTNSHYIGKIVLRFPTLYQVASDRFPVSPPQENTLVPVCLLNTTGVEGI